MAKILEKVYRYVLVLSLERNAIELTDRDYINVASTLRYHVTVAYTSAFSSEIARTVRQPSTISCSNNSHAVQGLCGD